MIRRPLAAIALLAALAAPVAAQNCFDAGFGVSLGADTVDTVYPMQPLGFGFPIGNAMYTHVHVNDHGFVQLSNGGTPAPLASGSPALAAPTVPNLLAAGPAVAAFYADIVLTGGGECFLRSSPTQCTVTWRNVRPRSQPTAPRFTFQLQLLSTGEVRCVYGPGVTNAGPVVVGVTPAGVTSAPPTVNLSTTATSATTATLEAFAAINTFDLGNNTLRLQRAGVGFAHQLLGAPGSACAATTTFGAGCDGLGLDAIGLPGLGNAGFTLRARTVPAVSPLALFAFGTLVVNPGVPLGPLLGMTGCTSYCNADIGMFAGAPATPGPAPLGATSTFGFSMPADTALLGATLSGQAVSFSLANPFGLAASNGIEIRVGQSGQGLFVAPSPALDMVPIAPGTFLMGSTAGQANEQPVHPVTITYPFWMGRYEVTQGQYQSRIGSNPSYFQGANAPSASLRPVENVSRSDAMAYCQALTTQERAAGRVPDGYQYRLPTEAEWEYCCRAGTTTEWHTGASLTTAQANIQGALANASWPVGQTSIVGSYAPNAWGLHDMHGNVREWCLDAFASYVAGAATDPYVDNNGNRIFRGGSWINTSTASLCRSALRASASGLSYKNAMLGFRVVLAPTLVISESLDLQRIEPGTFLMGSNNGGALGYEAPVHQVTLTRPFWMAKHEVTQADFLAIMGFNPSLFDATYMIDWPNRPVEQTTRADAATYCRLVDAAERAAGRVPPGYQYRLPTEAEWEYCCRAGTATEWNTGATITTAQANYAGAFPASGAWGQGATALVGSYPPNPWGLYDMHGNVWEWCLDQVATYPAGPVVDPYVTSGMYPAIRGGSWSVQSSASVVRSANRGNAATPLLLGGAGFRIVLGPALLP